MTATITQFTVGETCDERFPELPVGTAVCATGADPLINTVYIKQPDGRWQHRNNLTDEREGASFPDSSFESDNHYASWQIAALPGVQVGHEFGGLDDLFRSLPVGTCIQYRHWTGENHYVKTANNEWFYRNSLSSERDGSASDASFDTEGWRVWRLPEEGAQQETPTSVTIPASAVQPGMYLQINENVRFFVLTVDGTAWTGINFATNLDVELEPNFARNANAYPGYQVIAQDELLWRALARLGNLSENPVDPEALRQEGRAAMDQVWRERMERFDVAAKQLAEQKGYCSDYDEFAEEWGEVGLTPRVVDQEYRVTLEITGTVSTTVTMPEDCSAEELYEAARDSISINEGSSYTMHSESFEVTEVRDDNYDVV